MPSRPEPARRRSDRGAGQTLATGVWLFPDAPAESIVAAVHRAEELGLDEFWIGDEGPARDPFALLAAAAAVTTRIRLGVAVTNPYVRHPAITAVAAMTIHELSDGRAILGIGPGGSIALDPLGIVRQRPLGRTRDAVRVIRAVSRGVPTEGFTPPADPFTVWNLPIYVGARGEGFNRYASAEADGVFVGGVPMPNHELVIGWARSVRPVKVALYVNGIFDPDTEEQVRPRLIFGLLDAPAQFRDSLGLRLEDVRIAADAFAAGDPSLALDLVSDEVFDALSLHGPPAVVGAGLAQLVKTHRPASIGLAILVDDPVAALDPVAAAFQHMKEVLA